MVGVDVGDVDMLFSFILKTGRKTSDWVKISKNMKRFIIINYYGQEHKYNVSYAISPLKSPQGSLTYPRVF